MCVCVCMCTSVGVSLYVCIHVSCACMHPYVSMCRGGGGEGQCQCVCFCVCACMQEVKNTDRGRWDTHHNLQLFLSLNVLILQTPVFKLSLSDLGLQSSNLGQKQARNFHFSVISIIFHHTVFILSVPLNSYICWALLPLVFITNV